MPIATNGIQTDPPAPAGGMKYVDRGDPATPDFLPPIFTLDGAWHELDLSSVVPPEAANHLVHITTEIGGETIGALFQIKKGGNVNNANSARLEISFVGPPDTYEDLQVMISSDRKILYMAEEGIFQVTLLIRGWWTD